MHANILRLPNKNVCKNVLVCFWASHMTRKSQNEVIHTLNIFIKLFFTWGIFGYIIFHSERLQGGDSTLDVQHFYASEKAIRWSKLIWINMGVNSSPTSVAKNN